jgi:hypothetical protein
MNKPSFVTPDITPEWKSIKYLADNDFSAVLDRRQKLYLKRKEIQQELTTLSQELAAMLVVAGVKTVQCGEWTATAKEYSGRKSLSRKVLSQEMVKHLEARLVKEIVDTATKVSTPYMTFTAIPSQRS